MLEVEAGTRVGCNPEVVAMGSDMMVVGQQEEGRGYRCEGVDHPAAPAAESAEDSPLWLALLLTSLVSIWLATFLLLCSS